MEGSPESREVSLGLFGDAAEGGAFGFGFDRTGSFSVDE